MDGVTTGVVLCLCAMFWPLDTGRTTTSSPTLGCQLFLFSRHAMAAPVVLMGVYNEETGF